MWALHSTSHVLSSWAPRGVVYPGLHWTTKTLGVACVGLFVWQIGPSVGLAAWNNGDALCGCELHLNAILGVELAQWILSPVEVLLMGL